MRGRILKLYDSKARQRERAFVIEGVRLVEEALRAGVALEQVFVAAETLGRTPRGRELLNRLRPYHPRPVSEQALKSLAGTVTPQGVVAIVPEPAPEPIDPAGLLVVVLDALSDPGNAGTILRTAWASGIVRTVVGLGSVDLYSAKVVRAAAGAHFHLQLLAAPRWAVLREELAGRRLFVAAAGLGTPYYEAGWSAPAALIIGSEAHGVRPEVVKAADELVQIPMPGAAESLNASVAAGILIFEALRQIRKGMMK